MQPLTAADTNLIRSIQQKLKTIGIDPGPIDGDPGPKTHAAWAQFKRLAHEVNLDKYADESLANLEHHYNNAKEKTLWVTNDQITNIFGRQLTVTQLEDLNRCLKKYDIVPGPRAWHFLSQVAHETGGGQWWLELASGEAYEGRQNLGNNRPGDGPKFKGSGGLMLTGRYNYQRFANDIGDAQVIVQGASYTAAKYPFCSAGWFWQQNKLNNTADRGATVKIITRIINGGLNGLAEREHYFELCKKHIKS
jgi:putative chitinase